MDANHNNTDNNDAKKERGWSAFGLISAIGADMAVCTVGGTYAGMWLDKVFGSAPWMLLVGVLVGLTAGVLGIIQILKAFGPESNR